MEKKMLPEKEYLESLPKKRMGVGVLVFFEKRLLILKPTYKTHWLLPGGVIDLDESPREAARREVFEELGLKLEIKELLVVDYLHRKGERTECIQFLFSGGEVSKAQMDAIRLQDEEISAMQLMEIDKAKELLDEKTRQRLSMLERHPGKILYLENGEV